MTALLGAGGTFNARPGRPPAATADMHTFKTANAVRADRPCRYGRATVAGILAESRAVTPGSAATGRHGWTVRAVTRVVELTRAGCAWTGNLDAIEDRLTEIKPEGGTSFDAVLSCALANARGDTRCGLHRTRRVA